MYSPTHFGSDFTYEADFFSLLNFLFFSLVANQSGGAKASENLKHKTPVSFFQGEKQHDTSLHHLVGILMLLKGGAVVTRQLSSQGVCDMAEHDNTNLFIPPRAQWTTARCFSVSRYPEQHQEL